MTLPRARYFRRNANHVGRVRIKLAELIQDAFKAGGITARVEPDDLVPNQGYWRIDKRADVMPWSGTAYMRFAEDLPWRGVPIGSWTTMTDLCKTGVEIQRDGFFWEVVEKD